MVFFTFLGYFLAILLASNGNSYSFLAVLAPAQLLTILFDHTLNEQQIDWFKAGIALNRRAAVAALRFELSSGAGPWLKYRGKKSV